MGKCSEANTASFRGSFRAIKHRELGSVAAKGRMPAAAKSASLISPPPQEIGATVAR